MQLWSLWFCGVASCYATISFFEWFPIPRNLGYSPYSSSDNSERQLVTCFSHERQPECRWINTNTLGNPATGGQIIIDRSMIQSMVSFLVPGCTTRG